MSKPSEVEDQQESRIIIVYRANSPKLTARGKGEFEYELGVDSETEEQLIRISDNPQGGSFSKEWVGISKIEALLDNRGKDQHSFKSAFLKVFNGRSANNPGLLAASLLNEKCLIRPLPDQPTLLTSASFDGIKSKITECFAEGIDRTDNVAKKLKQRETEKAKRKEERAQAKIKENGQDKSNTETTSESTEPVKPEIVKDKIPKTTTTKKARKSAKKKTA